jgi:putative alpha-1,2-mannosidase
MFDKATLRLAGGRTLVITKQGSGVYVQRVSLNGDAYSNAWLPLNKLQPGTTQLYFETDAVPNKQRGSDLADRPPSFR